MNLSVFYHLLPITNYSFFQACPFEISIYAEKGEPKLRVSDLSGVGQSLESAICEAVMQKVGETVGNQNKT